MIRFQPFVANVATCGGVGTGWVWNVKVYVADGVSTQTFTVAVNGTTVATLTGSESYGPFRVVGPDTLTVTANSASDTQVVTLDGNVVYTNPPDITDPEQGLVAPLTLPAEPGKPLITQGGNTLDDGSGKAQFLGGASTFPAGTTTPGQFGLGDTPTLFLKAGGYFLGIPESIVIMSGSGPALSIKDNSAPDFSSSPGYGSVGVLDIFGNFIGGNVAGTGYVQPNGAAKLSSGTGAPTIAGTAGDFFFRTDTPSTTNQRIYVCTASGNPGTWVGIV